MDDIVKQGFMECSHSVFCSCCKGQLRPKKVDIVGIYCCDCCGLSFVQKGGPSTVIDGTAVLKDEEGIE